MARHETPNTPAMAGRGECCAPEAGSAVPHRHRHTPRDEASLRQLRNRLSRMTGQLQGIGKMLDENRYCGDILIQIAAIEKALQAFGYIILQDHMRTCMAEDIRAGSDATIDEVVELVKKLK